MTTPDDPYAAHDAQTERENAEMEEVMRRPLGGRLAEYTKRSGPGWLQGAITLGGGSLAGALYLGTIMGNHMMWLQPLAMILGVIMLSAIAYVTLSTGLRPFRAINEHVSPVLGWAWIIATLMANIVWCMPQFALGSAAVQQNLMPSLSSDGAKVAICAALFVAALVVNLFYESGGRGLRLFEWILKGMVAVIVLSFFGVVIKMSAVGVLDWGAIFAGLVPDLSLLSNPAPTFAEPIAATGEAAGFWTRKIAADQRDIMMTAFGTAVGINMTFLLPYSMLRKGWGKHHRGLAIFDLSIGLIIPFVLATACVVIAAASQFHAQTDDVLLEDGSVRPEMQAAVDRILDARLEAEPGDAFSGLDAAGMAAARAALPEADHRMAAMLVKRDNFNLANALVELTGPQFAQVVFGIGVLGMALSTIIILMLINGFTLCEMLDRPGNRAVHLLGAVISGVGGFAGLFLLWDDSRARAALAVPTSVLGGALIPIAYFTFLLLMNSRSLLGRARPTGGRALAWNLLMLVATGLATFGSIWAIKDKTIAMGEAVIPAGKIGIGVLVVLFVVGTAGFLASGRRHAAARTDAGGAAPPR